MSVLTVTSVVLILLGGLTRLGWPRALGLAGATPAGAAVVLGSGVAIPTFATVALAAVAAFGLRELAAAVRTGRRVRPIPGLLALTLFFCWVVALTLFAPILFDGFSVTGPAVGEIHILDSATQPATSNIAQTAYLALGIGSMALVAGDHRAGFSGALIMLVTSTLLSSWALLHRDLGVPFPVGVFDNSPSFQYISTAPGGVERFRGIFPEPSALATISLAAIAFLVALIPRTHGIKRIAAVLAIALALWNVSVSTATTAIVSGIALLMLAVVTFLYRFFVRRQQVASGLVVALCLCGVALLPLLPVIADGISSAINDKVGSSSYDDRSGADAFSYDLTIRTFGIGVGLGSNRPSSLLAGLLSTTGVVGVALLLGVIGYLLWQTRGESRMAPVWWAFVSFMLTRFISSPDLGDPTGLTWLCMGALAGTVAARREGDDPTVTRRVRPAPALPVRTDRS